MDLSTLMNEVYMAYRGVTEEPTDTSDCEASEMSIDNAPTPLFADTGATNLKRRGDEAILALMDGIYQYKLKNTKVEIPAIQDLKFKCLPTDDSVKDQAPNYLTNFEALSTLDSDDIQIPKPSFFTPSNICPQNLAHVLRSAFAPRNGDPEKTDVPKIIHHDKAIALNSLGQPILLPTVYSPPKSGETAADVSKNSNVSRTVRTPDNLLQPVLVPKVHPTHNGDPTKIDSLRLDEASQTFLRHDSKVQLPISSTDYLRPTVTTFGMDTESTMRNIQDLMVFHSNLKGRADRISALASTLVADIPALSGNNRHIAQVMRRQKTRATVRRPAGIRVKTPEEYYMGKPLPPVPQSIDLGEEEETPLSLQEKMEHYFASMLHLQDEFHDQEEISDSMSLHSFPQLCDTSSSSESINSAEICDMVKRGSMHKLRELVNGGRIVPGRVLTRRISALDHLEGKKPTPAALPFWLGGPMIPVSQLGEIFKDLVSKSSMADASANPTRPSKATPGLNVRGLLLKAGHKLAPNRFQARPIDNPDDASAKAAAVLGLAKRARARKGIPSTIMAKQ